MAKLRSLLTDLLHVKNLAYIHGFDVGESNGVVRVHFDLNPYKPKLGYRNTESPGKFFKMSSARGHLFF